ncbi:unnamed protein product [Cylindrotheca closterium]|uniref:Uncharacterized protein n=1 Tax=Cylindrotheca closterium TaxID=2856 RepID=A0AAD2CRI8_9STRA|nr:unnamed protein product [Cylindrotheca closterium]
MVAPYNGYILATAWDMAEAILMSRTGFDGQVGGANMMIVTINDYILVSNWDMATVILMSRTGFDGQNAPI